MNLGKFSRLGLAQTCRAPAPLSRLESQGFGCSWFGFHQTRRSEEPGTVLFITRGVHILDSWRSLPTKWLVGSIHRNNGLVNRNTEWLGMTRKQLTGKTEIPGSITESPRTAHCIILNCEIIIDNPILHSSPLTGKDVGNIKQICKRCSEKALT